MTMKSVLDVEVNDEQFKAFYDLFEEYKKHLGTMPDDWSKIDKATKAAGKSFEAATGGTLAILEEISLHTKAMASDLKDAIKAQKEFGKASRTSGGELKKMAGYAKSLGSHIFGIGKYLFKVGALGGGVSLLGGFGLRELGESAVSTQHEARGIGVSPGQLKAWRVDMSRYVDPGMLGKVANAQTTPQGLLSLSIATGIPMGQLSNMAPDAIAQTLANRERSFWKSAPAGLQTMMPQWTQGFGRFSSPEEARRLAASGSGALSAAEARYRSDTSSLNIDAKTVRAWYSFTRELSYAGQKIETVLTNRLAALAPYMSGFVDSITKSASLFINSALTPENIKKFGEGMNEFAAYIGSPKFRGEVKQVREALSDLVSAIVWAGGEVKKSSFARHHPLGVLSYHRGKLPPNATPAQRAENFIFGRDPFKQFETPSNASARMSSGFIGGKRAYLASLDRHYGLPSGTLWSIYGAESSYGKNAGPSSAGALGPFQLMPATAASLGVKNPMDFAQSAIGAAKLMHQNMMRFHDIKKAVAAYNSRPSTVAAAVAASAAKGSSNWMAGLPRETQRYVPRVMSGIKVTIDNRTSANVSVQANAAGY